MTRASLRRFGVLLETQFNEFRRDFGSVFLVFAFPLMFAVVTVFVALSHPSFTFSFGVVEAAPNADAARLVHLLQSNGEMKATAMTKVHAERALTDGDIKAILFIPAGNLRDGSAKLKLEVAPGYGDVAVMALDLARYNLATGAKLMKLPVPYDSLSGQVTKLRLPFSYVVTAQPMRVDSQFNFLFPALFAMALLELGLFATAVPLLRARERGTFRHLMLTPLRKEELLFTQLTLRLFLAAAQFGALLAVAVYAGVHLTLHQSMLFFVAALLGMIMLVSLGYMLAGIPSNIEAGMSVVMIANFVMLFGGNVFWDPRSSMLPKFLAYALPLTYLSDAFRQIMTGITGLMPLPVDFLVMALWSAVTISIALVTFRFDSTSDPSVRVTKLLRYFRPVVAK